MNQRFPTYYILLDRTPIAVNLKTWAKWFETFENRHLFSEDIGGRSLVSTVFLGLDHNFSSKGDPILFETMVFEGPLAGEMMRYRSYADAERGHAAMVVEVRKACAQIKAIADQAGATFP